MVRQGPKLVNQGDAMSPQPNAAAARSSALSLVPLLVPSSSRLLFLAQVSCLLLFFLGVSRFADRRNGLTSTIHFGSEFEARSLDALQQVHHRAIERDSVGYDGQFYAQIALSPLLTDPKLPGAIDAVAYRGRRILFSWTAWLLGLGQPKWVIHAYAVQNVLFWLATAVVLQHWLPLTNWFNFCRWAAILFSSGMLVSVSRALTDGPALFVLLLGIYLTERGWRWWGAAVIGLSMLGKETNLLGGLACMNPPAQGKSRFGNLVAALPTLLLQGLLLVLPLAVWLAYISFRIGTAEFGGSRNFSFPFVALAGACRETADFVAKEGLFSFHCRAAILCLAAFAVQVGYFLTRWDSKSTWWRIGASYAILGICLGSSVLECFPGASTRALLPMLAAFNLSLKPNRTGWILCVVGNLGVIDGLQAMQLLRFQ
jgi:hypothetical protein